MNFSENSRIWIYQAERELKTEETESIQEMLNAFTQTWEAHGKSLAARGEIRYQRFIILAVDEIQAGATGCSIDKSVGLMKQIEQKYQINLFNRMQIAYRDGLAIKTCTKAEFSSLLDTGVINDETIVFNNLIQTYRELENGWEIPMKDSWHSRVFAV